MLASALQVQAQDAGNVVWETDGFGEPETVLFDPDRELLYVSNIAGEPLGVDGLGYISRVGVDGQIRDLEWVTGLDAPKGMVLAGSTLYVADISRLVAIDAEAGEIVASWDAEGAQFLNDVAADGEGRVYVSDMLTNRIYVLENDALSVWLEGDALMHPNGLDLADGRLLVSARGQDMQPDFSTLVPGHVLAIDLATKELSALGSGDPIGNLDGLEQAGDTGWLATDWIAGALIRVRPDGSHDTLIDLDMGSANLEFLAAEKIAIVPMMLDGRIVAYHVD